MKTSIIKTNPLILAGTAFILAVFANVLLVQLTHQCECGYSW